MLTSIRRRLGAVPQGPWLLGSAIALAVLVAPFAVAQTANNGTTVKGGARNPSADQRQSYTKETEIIADTSTYGTRQSNKSSNGGGAIYGCRSGLGGTEKNNEPCLRANNLEDGRAFELASSGKNATEVGVITAQNPNAAPAHDERPGRRDRVQRRPRRRQERRRHRRRRAGAEPVRRRHDGRRARGGP